MFFPKCPFRGRVLFLVAGLLAGLVGCAFDSEPSISPPSHLGQLRKQLPHNVSVQEALRKVKAGEWAEASRLLNITLQNFPKQAYVHILNGVVYEHMADRGYDGKRELALVAYQTALKLDPTNWHALYFTGRLNLKNQDYGGAQEYLANALLLKPNDALTLHDLAVASYYARDLDLARSSIQKALQLRSTEPLFHRSAAMIFAATGEREQAQKNFVRYAEKMNQADPDVPHVAARLQDWHQAHAAFQTVADVTSTPVPSAPSAPSSAVTSAPETASPSAPSSPSTAPAVEPLPKGTSNPVIILDCYLLRVSENAQTEKGQNLLDSFKDSIGLIINPRNVNHNYVKTSYPATDMAATPMLVKTFTGSIGFGLINYNLNIANATDTRIEVLGRPTLSAFLNKKANFSSGDTLKGGIPGTNGGSLGEVPTGVFLEVTPTNVEGDEITLDISLEGSLLGAFATDQSISNQLISLAKTKVVTTLRLGFGETGMLGGIYERTDQYVKSGVPLLQDIPGVQYFFSHEATSSLRKSVLFLVTPRRTENVNQQVEAHFKEGPHNKKRWEKQPHVQEFVKKGGGNWYSSATPPALISILHQMERFYYQFRAGDVFSAPYWGTTPTLEEELDQISGFLYY